MRDNPNAELIAIGTELLLGEITDTNSVFMARKLRDIGVNVYFMTTVGDNLERISSAVSNALDRAEIVLTCGGLGPTVDDMTRQAVSNATDRSLEFHQHLYDNIAERFRGFGTRMTENNRQQAFLPEGARLIENPVGTAPAFVVEAERGTVISLPGVPREMMYLMTESVLPYLLGKYNLGVIVARTLRTAGIGESSLDHMIGRDLLNERNPSVGLAAHHGCVDIRVTAKAATKEEATDLLNDMQRRLVSRIGEHVFGKDEDTLESVVLQLLERHQLNVHVIEAGLTGVLTASLDRETPHLSSSSYSHPEETYRALQLHPEDMSLKDLAVAAAIAARDERKVDASLVLLSYPDLNENADVEQGSAIAVATASGTRFRVYGFGARSNLATEWLPRWGLANLWRMLRREHENGM